MSRISGVYVVKLGKHCKGRGAGHRCDSRAKEYPTVKAYELKEQTGYDGDYHKSYGAEIVYLARAEDLTEGAGGKKRAYYKHRDRGTERCRKLKALHYEGREGKEGTAAKIEYKAYHAGNCSEIEKLFGCELYIVSLSCKDNDAPCPEKYVKGHNKECAHKFSLSAEKRSEYRYTEESDVSEDGGKFSKLLLIAIFKTAECHKGQQSHENMYGETEGKCLKSKREIFCAVLHFYERVYNQSGLTDLYYERGEPF